MKRRNFLKRSVIATGAVVVTGPTMLWATKKKQLDKGIFYAPYIPIITASMPELQPGEMGILYGLTGSGKSKVIYELANRQFSRGKIAIALDDDSLLIDLEVNPDMRVFKNLETIIRDYPRKNVYIDNVDLIRYGDTEKNFRSLSYFLDGRRNLIYELRKIAQDQQCKIWITSQAINKRFTASHLSSSLMPIYEASCIVYIRHENGHIYGDILKDRYGADHKIYFGKAKYLGVKK